MGLSRLFGLFGLFGLFRPYAISEGFGFRGMLAPSLGRPQRSFGRQGPRSRSWKIEAPPPSRSEKRRQPVITYQEKPPVTG